MTARKGRSTMTQNVTAKDLKVLTRRRDYLEGLGNEGNSYDTAEIKALTRVLGKLTPMVCFPDADIDEKGGSGYELD